MNVLKLVRIIWHRTAGLIVTLIEFSHTKSIHVKHLGFSVRVLQSNERIDDYNIFVYRVGSNRASVYDFFAARSKI